MILEVRACFTSGQAHPPQTVTNRTIRHFAEALSPRGVVNLLVMSLG